MGVGYFSPEIGLFQQNSSARLKLPAIFPAVFNCVAMNFLMVHVDLFEVYSCTYNKTCTERHYCRFGMERNTLFKMLVIFF